MLILFPIYSNYMMGYATLMAICGVGGVGGGGGVGGVFPLPSSLFPLPSAHALYYVRSVDSRRRPTCAYCGPACAPALSPTCTSNASIRYSILRQRIDA